MPPQGEKMEYRYLPGCWRLKPTILLAILLFGLVFLSVTMAQARPVGELSPPLIEPLDRFDCNTPTPGRSDGVQGYPGREKIITSNRLAMPAGKPVPAEGQIVYLMGRVYDKNCVPVKGAKIELWQTNSKGKYDFASTAELLSPEPVFAGTGQTFSNNMGEYQFITVFPGPYGRRAPHIHLRVSHPDFPTIETEVFFAKDHRNEKDPNLKRFRKKLRDAVLADMRNAGPQGGMIASFDIVLSGKNKFRQF